MNLSDYVLDNTIHNYNKYIKSDVNKDDFYYELFWRNDKSEIIINKNQLNKMFDENIFL